MKKVSHKYIQIVLAGILCCLFFGTCCPRKIKNEKEDQILIKVNKKRVLSGDSVLFTVSTPPRYSVDELRVFLLQPLKGVKKLKLEKKGKNEFTGIILPEDNRIEGFYEITVIGGKKEKLVGKVSYLIGKVIGDFAIMSNFVDTTLRKDMLQYLNEFRSVGGNMIVLHANTGTEIKGDGTLEECTVWASKVCKKAVPATKDRIEMMLSLTDSLGLPSFISVTWDLTDKNLSNTRYMENMDRIIEEQWSMYSNHPSLIGFYSSQEGSGTYFAGYIREFCRQVKIRNSGLLTMCAPNIDDPLLAGYLAAIDELDVLNFQAPVMTSYRPDNRKLYPNRRVKDITSLSSGATRINDKITLSHIELMGYLENKAGSAYLTNYENIFNQFPSVASAYGPDGTTLFSYFSCIYSNSKKLPQETSAARKAVSDGLKTYHLISEMVTTSRSHLAIYVPYSDWCIERWNNSILPAADALAKLGVYTDIIPFIPPKGEDILPYYPMHTNQTQLKYFLDHQYILILPDISGMQETDSEMLESFVKQGGTVIAFGPRIPYGDRFDREKLWGAKEITPVQAEKRFDRLQVVKFSGKRTKPGLYYSFTPVISTSWEPSDENRIANFGDGTASVFSSQYGNGNTYVVTLSATDAVRICPDLLRDILDEALKEYQAYRPFDVTGMTGTMDISMTGNGNDCSLSLSNYGNTPFEFTIKPLHLDENSRYTLTDLKTGDVLSAKTGKDYREIPVRIEGNDFRAYKLSKAGSPLSRSEFNNKNRAYGTKEFSWNFRIACLFCVGRRIYLR